MEEDRERLARLIESLADGSHRLGREGGFLCGGQIELMMTVDLAVDEIRRLCDAGLELALAVSLRVPEALNTPGLRGLLDGFDSAGLGEGIEAARRDLADFDHASAHLHVHGTLAALRRWVQRGRTCALGRTALARAKAEPRSVERAKAKLAARLQPRRAAFDASE